MCKPVQSSTIWTHSLHLTNAHCNANYCTAVQQCRAIQLCAKQYNSCNALHWVQCCETAVMRCNSWLQCKWSHSGSVIRKIFAKPFSSPPSGWIWWERRWWKWILWWPSSSLYNLQLAPYGRRPCQRPSSWLLRSRSVRLFIITIFIVITIIKLDIVIFLVFIVLNILSIASSLSSTSFVNSN